MGRFLDYWKGRQMADTKLGPWNRLAQIAALHVRESEPYGGMVGDLCVECEHTWPCPTYELAASPCPCGEVKAHRETSACGVRRG